MPVRLARVTRVLWKNEDEVEGQPIGPVTLVLDGQTRMSRPFDPNRPVDPWVTLAEARRIAAEYGVELEES